VLFPGYPFNFPLIFPPNLSLGRMNRPKGPCLINKKQGLFNSGKLAEWIPGFEAIRANGPAVRDGPGPAPGQASFS
jgi:hypothetical protein